MQQQEDILIQAFIIFIKDDGTLTDKDILEGFGYPNHKKVAEEFGDYNIKICRFGEWIYIVDSVHENWLREQTWRFMAKVTKRYEVIHCMMDDIVDGGTFGYHKDGNLIRLLEYVEKDWSDNTMVKKIDIGTPLPREEEIIENDRSLWFTRLAETLGIDIKASNKHFTTYDDLIEDYYAYEEKYSNEINSENPNHFTPHNYYKK